MIRHVYPTSEYYQRQYYKYGKYVWHDIHIAYSLVIYPLLVHSGIKIPILQYV